MSPFLADRIGELKSWDDIKLLSVAVDRLQQWWRPGLLCIGDAAHAMSPIGGVGINMAVQDAVAAANRLAAPLQASARVTDEDLHAIEQRRTLPVRFHAMAAAHHSEADHQPRAWKASSGRSRRCCSRLFSAVSGFAPAFRRGCSASASGRSTFTRRTCLRARDFVTLTPGAA